MLKSRFNDGTVPGMMPSVARQQGSQTDQISPWDAKNALI
jgi:hypothetical protein